MQQQKQCLKSFLSGFGSFDAPKTPMRQFFFCSQAAKVLQIYQNLIKITSNVIYILAFSGGLKYLRKIHYNRQCTEMRFASFLSGGFITAIVVNPPERKLAKRTSVQCAGGGISHCSPGSASPCLLKNSAFAGLCGHAPHRNNFTLVKFKQVYCL